MELRSLLYLFIFPAWEFLLMIALPPRYYVKTSCLQIHPYPICGFHFGSSATFVLLATVPFLIAIILGLWKKWSELVAFGVPSLAVVLITVIFLYLFERSWIPLFVPATASVVLYSLPRIKSGKANMDSHVTHSLVYPLHYGVGWNLHLGMRDFTPPRKSSPRTIFHQRTLGRRSPGQRRRRGLGRLSRGLCSKPLHRARQRRAW